MKNTSFLFLLLLTGFLGQISVCAQTTTNKNNKESQILALVLKTLNDKHINPVKIDDAFSRKMLISYINELDDNRIFFLDSDIKEFKQYETKLDEQIKNNDLNFFYLTKERYLLRMAQSKEIYLNILKNKIDFTKKEFYKPELIIEYPKNTAELSENWNRYIKSEILYNLKQNYNPNLSRKQFDEILLSFEKNNLPIIFERSYYNVDNMNKDIVFEFFINSIISVFDEHSKYFLPTSLVEYKIKQTGKVIGPGIKIAMKNGYVEVNSLIKGGPAEKTKKIDAGDAILKVGEKDQEPVNIAGKSIFDVAKLTRGIYGSTLVLTIKKINGSIETVPINREITSTNDSYVKSSIVNKNKVNYAVISIPRFYNESDESEIRNTPDDFEKELLILKQYNVQGLIIDIRDNIGGSLESALKILSNFLTKENVVQFKNQDGKTTILKSENDKKKWDKKVVILVNSNTASSAEMIAAAFQEQKIGIVLGEQTSGNVTIQNMLNLNELKENKLESDDFGALQVASKKFYKLNGSSIQNEGVIPDVCFCKIDNIKKKKIINSNIVKDQVMGIKIEPIILNNFSEILKTSNLRLKNNNIFKYLINNHIDEDLEKINSLNSIKFKIDVDNLLKKQGSSPLDNYSNNLEFLNTSNDEKIFKKREYLIQKRKDWYKSLSQDFEIDEGINILEDMNKTK